MLRLILVLLGCTFFISQSEAQLGNILKKAKNKTQQRIDQRIDNSIDKTLDKAEGKETVKTPPADNSSVATTNADAGEAGSESGFKSFARFDFIPGDSILYADDFAQEELGELPINWNTSGTGEVSTLENIPGNWLRLHKGFRYLSSNQKEFGENYTLEFDAVLQLKNNGWMFPELRVGVFASGAESNSANEFLKRLDKNARILATISPGTMNTSKVMLNSWISGKDHYSSAPKMYEVLEKSYFKSVHVAIQIQKERFRMWINSDKIFDAPKAAPLGEIMNQLYFEVGHTNYPEDKYGVFIGNIKIATGKPDTRHKLIEEGKFSTTGILFDFQSANIKPASYAVVKEIAGVLKQFPEIRVKILGHTSNDGDDKANMELSIKRANAVKELLATEFGIESNRIESEGRGETEPIADNKTKEGKTANRRVEFIKL